MVTLTPTVTVNGTAVDPCAVAAPVQVIMGRSGVTTQPDPPQASFGWVHSYGDPPAVGDLITIDVDPVYERAATWGDSSAEWGDPGWTWGGQVLASRRFTGWVQRVEARERRGDVILSAVWCSGMTSTMATTPIVHAELPEQTDIVRLTGAWLANPGYVRVRGDDTVTLIPETIDNGYLLTAIHDIAASAAAVVWEDSYGRCWYGTRSHRNRPASAVVDGCAVLDGISWDADASEVINSVTVGYGTASPQDTASYWDADSMAKPWGGRGVQVASKLASQTDAGELGAEILLRRAWPWWSSSDVMVDSRTIPTLAGLHQLSRLEVGDVVLLPIPAAPGPVPDPGTKWVVEGWIETWWPDHVTMQLAVSEAARWGSSPLTTWQTVLDGGSWADYTAGSWLDMLNGD